MTPPPQPDSELDRQLDKLIYKNLLDWIPIDMADSAQTDGLVLHLKAIKELLKREKAAAHSAGYEAGQRDTLDVLEPLTHNGRGTILWEVDAIGEKIGQLRAALAHKGAASQS